jgi:tight adherence protein B
VYAVRRRRRSGRRQRAAEQVADAVSAVAAGLRAGLSLPQAFAYARDEAEEPLRSELGDLVDAIDTGTPITDALSDWADAQGSEDARLIAGVLDLHRRSGGDLPGVLDGLTSTLRERRAAHREVRALTAQARLSGVILGLLPIGFFAFLLITSRREMLDAIGTPIGGTALGIGLGLELVAFVWIRHLLEVR